MGRATASQINSISSQIMTWHRMTWTIGIWFNSGSMVEDYKT